MGDVIKPELSKKNKWYLNKHRMYELKHFCLQYPSWIIEYKNLSLGYSPCGMIRILPDDGTYSDKTEEVASLMAELDRKIRMVRESAKEADPELDIYIFKAATEGLGYEKLNPSCCREVFYEKYRKFFVILSQKRG